jgi:hypothetical protein
MREDVVIRNYMHISHNALLSMLFHGHAAHLYLGFTTFRPESFASVLLKMYNLIFITHTSILEFIWWNRFITTILNFFKIILRLIPKYSNVSGCLLLPCSRILHELENSFTKKKKEAIFGRCFGCFSAFFCWHEDHWKWKASAFSTFRPVDF